MIHLSLDSIADRIIGVIDLKAGRAVHAIAGRRDQYAPLAYCDGDPVSLALHYRSVGVSRLYLADLDAITGNAIQCDSIRDVCAQSGAAEILLDIGWHGDATDRINYVATIANSFHNVFWIVATESAQSTDAFGKLAQLVTAERVFLGLDYQGGQPLGKVIDETSLIEQVAKANGGGVVILDLASVGMSHGPVTGAICSRVKNVAPKLAIYSGGGIRTIADAQALFDAGCDRCLVATALHPTDQTATRPGRS